MFGKRWRLFSLLGIPINVDASWLIILALIVWSLRNVFASDYPKSDYPELEVWHYWAMAVVAALTFFVCIVLHELGHAVVARSLGMPMRGITLFLFGGVAEMEGEPPSAGSEFLMAIAGPAVSLVLAIVFGVLYLFGSGAGWPVQVTGVFAYLGEINAILLVFNMIPAFPLDGGRVLRSLLWGVSGNSRWATRWASFAGQGFSWVLFGLAILLFFSGNLMGGIWLGLIGMFLNNAAKSSYQQLVIRDALRGEPIRRFMCQTPTVVPPSVDLRHWVEDYVYRYHRKVFPVATNGRLEGVISTRALAQIPQADWDRHTVGEVMDPNVAAASLPPDADALQALGKMQRTGMSRLLVTDGDNLVGIVSLKDLLSFLDQKIELENMAK